MGRLPRTINTGDVAIALIHPHQSLIMGDGIHLLSRRVIQDRGN